MKKAYGFTLIEMVITIVVAIVLLGIAIPSFRFMLANNRATAQANALYSALNYARGEAIGRKTTVTVCPNDPSSTVTTPVCGANTDWANGWFVFVDGGVIGTFDGGDAALKHWSPLPGDATLAATQAYIGFNSDGSKRTAINGEVTINMSEADTTGDADRCIRVESIGSIRVHKITATATCPLL